MAEGGTGSAPRRDEDARDVLDSVIEALHPRDGSMPTTDAADLAGLAEALHMGVRPSLVGSGHDEQTEGPYPGTIPANLPCLRCGVGPITHVGKDHAYLADREPERRAVAAVVDALQERARFHREHDDLLLLAAGLNIAIDVVRERFGSSVSGGRDT